MRTFLVLVIAFFASASSFASGRVENDVQMWNQFTLTAVHSEKIRSFYEAQGRTAENIREFDQLLLRGALGYQFHPHCSAWIGYGWFPHFYPHFSRESRVWQQWLSDIALDQYVIQNRTRLEERTIQNVPDIAVRLRHLARLVWNLDEAKKWFVSFNDEIFFHLNTVPRGPKAGLDQNRAYTGVGRNFSPHLRIEVDYLNNFVNRPEPYSNRMNHVILTSVNFNY